MRINRISSPQEFKYVAGKQISGSRILVLASHFLFQGDDDPGDDVENEQGKEGREQSERHKNQSNESNVDIKII